MRVGLREYFEVDKDKLKPEDRLHLLNKAHTEILFNNHGLMQNTATLLSLLAILIATFALVFSQNAIHWIIKLLFALVELLLLFYYLKKNKEASKIIWGDIYYTKAQYDELFKYHLNYAKKKEKNDKPENL